jgi:hypothetical protein
MPQIQKVTLTPKGGQCDVQAIPEQSGATELIPGEYNAAITLETEPAVVSGLGYNLDLRVNGERADFSRSKINLNKFFVPLTIHPASSPLSLSIRFCKRDQAKRCIPAYTNVQNYSISAFDLSKLDLLIKSNKTIVALPKDAPTCHGKLVFTSYGKVIGSFEEGQNGLRVRDELCDEGGFKIQYEILQVEQTVKVSAKDATRKMVKSIFRPKNLKPECSATGEATYIFDLSPALSSDYSLTISAGRRQGESQIVKIPSGKKELRISAQISHDTCEDIDLTEEFTYENTCRSTGSGRGSEVRPGTGYAPLPEPQTCQASINVASIWNAQKATSKRYGACTCEMTFTATDGPIQKDAIFEIFFEHNGQQLVKHLHPDGSTVIKVNPTSEQAGPCSITVKQCR